MTHGPFRRLITGAGGFIGEHCYRYCLDQGDAVVGTIRRRPIEPGTGQVVSIDLTDANAVEALIRSQPWSGIIHIAALADASRCEQEPDQAAADIVAATAHLRDAAGKHAPRAPFVMMSTDLVFDGEHAPYHETDVPGPITTYGRLKTQAEQIALAHPLGCVVRPALVSGRPLQNGGGFLDWMVGSLRRGQLITLFEDEYRTPIDVLDLALALRGIVARGWTGVWHAGGPESLNRLQMGQQVCAHFGITTELLQARKLSDVNLPVRRARDVSLVSDRLWSSLPHQPRSFADMLRTHWPT